MMFTVGSATQLHGIAGIRLGQVTDVPENGEFGETLDEIMARWARVLGVPYLGRAAIGHAAGNMVVPFGAV
jgi:muramoyltetrapeptide carboxypeptidase